jgi:hypothetical protein
VDLANARRSVVNDAIYVSPTELHRLDGERILRCEIEVTAVA